MLALILGELGKLHEAVPIALKVVKEKPDDAAAQYGAALLLARDNKIESAIKRFRRAVAIQPGYAEAIEYIAYLDKNGCIDSTTRLVDDAISRCPESDPAAKGALLYARATLLERDARYEAALEAYEAGALLLRNNKTADLSAMERYIERLKQSFSAEFFSANESHAFKNSLPIFIVGVPRSGTTLVETILAAHSRVTAAGESILVSTVTAEYRSFEPVDLEHLNAQIGQGQHPWRDMGRRLKKAHANRYQRNRRITDKNLGHHLLLGAIGMIASGAPVIYCTREPAATAWSCFKTRFERGNEWSYDFDSIERYQNIYEDLMGHWQATLPENPILEVRYEDLVTDPEDVIPGILRHVGLKPEAACMTPHTARTPVSTASLAQVREPIHTKAISGWQRYEDWLRDRHPLFRTAGTSTNP
jgi:tetratricopeptide (TPR) repeat protein